MSYNLKAKEIKTKRLVDVQILKDWYLHSDGYTVNDCIMDEKDFNTLYEVISDKPHNNGASNETIYGDAGSSATPVIKENSKTDTQEGWKEWKVRLISYVSAKYLNVEERKYDSYVNTIAEFVSQEVKHIEHQAYKLGQEEAYRKSASVARGVECPEPQEYEPELLDMCYQTGEQIALAIEQLASNKEK